MNNRQPVNVTRFPLSALRQSQLHYRPGACRHSASWITENRACTSQDLLTTEGCRFTTVH